MADLTEIIIWNQLPNHSIKIESADSFSLDAIASFRGWLDVKLPRTTALQQVQRGVISNRPTLEPSYVGVTPAVPISRYADRVAYQLRVTSANAVISSWREGSLVVPTSLQFMQQFEAVARAFASTKHWEVDLAIGLVCHARRDYQEAIEHYRAAELLIQRDTKATSVSPLWDRHIKELAALVSDAQALRTPTPPPSPSLV